MAINFMKVRTGVKLLANAAPGSPEDGDIWYDSGSNQFSFRQNGSTINISTSAGTVTTVSVASANGFAGTVATATTTPAITISTTITGLLKGNGTAISAATANTDYLAASGWRAGQQSIGSASTTQAVTFSSTLGTTNYGVSVVLKNTTDTNPQFQSLDITAKSATGFTATWNGPTDTANYVLEWIAVLNN